MSCLRKPEQMDGQDVVTVEGLPDETRRILSEAFVLEGGVQCGFCIPGIIVRAASLMQHGKTGDRDAVAKALDGHLCRCTGYGRILDSIQTAGEACRNGGVLPSAEPRRHSYFGEEFGLRRNPAFVAQRRTAIDATASGAIDRRAHRRARAGARRDAVRRRHARARHAARRDGADRAPAREGPEDSHRRRRGDARRRPVLHGRRRSREPRHRPRTIPISRSSSPKAR